MAREVEQWVKAKAKAEEERRADKEEVLVPRRTVVEEAGLALHG